MDLQLPKAFKPRRILATIPEVKGERIELAELKGPGCIQRIWMGTRLNRRAILRIYWDGEEEPSVESPIGGLFRAVPRGGHVPHQQPLSRHFGSGHVHEFLSHAICVTGPDRG